MLVASGCSFSYNLGSMAGKNEALSQPAVAAPGSAGLPGGGSLHGHRQVVNGDGMPAENDLVHARIAVADAFSKGVSTRSTSWENPATGARGTITPIGTAYQRDGGGTCRDFLASYVHNENEAWLEGAACRGPDGRWTVTRLTPWSRREAGFRRDQRGTCWVV